MGNILSFIHLRRKTPRGQRSGHHSSGSRRFLHHGSRLHGFLRRLYAVAQASAFFVIRAKSNLKSRRLYSHPVEKATGVVRDQSILLTVLKSAGDYPDKPRRVRYYDAETNKTLGVSDQNPLLPAITIAQLYKQRWQVELFFKWIKQHLRIKSFFGTSENAVKTQI